MKKIFLLLSAIAYPSILIMLRQYPENHFGSFFSGISCAIPIVFFIYMVTKKNHYLKRKN